MFNQDYEHHINPIGTLISRYNGTVAQTQNLNFIIVNPFFPPTFANKIPERAKVAESLDFSIHLTYKQKYGDTHEAMVKLTKEFMQRLNQDSVNLLQMASLV
ncbi:hypothetical protein [Anabaena sp. UHCC 0187]|uniref:hypothetical protein n=1 Tax=Anabaena sp. UHCC 0187 TaxID=2590018 RepID=UPI0020C3315E|nr:hypothetical protein [Anabaena sp. UHCC 0187]